MQTAIRLLLLSVGVALAGAVLFGVAKARAALTPRSAQ